MIALALLAGGCASKPKATDAGPAPFYGDVAANAAQAKADNDKAVDLINAGKLGEAKVLLERAIVANAMYGPAHNNLGLVRFSQGQDYEAAWSFERAAKLMPRQGEPLNNIGLVYERAERSADAEQAFRSALELDPQNTEFAGNLARVRVRRGVWDEETKKLLQLIIDKDRRPSWVSWARMNLHHAPGVR